MVKCKLVRLTSNKKSIDGNPVVLVFLVGVCASKTQACAKGSEEVSQDSNDEQSGNTSHVTWKQK